MYLHPEMGLQEYEARARICDILKSHNFSIKDIPGVPTAFAATYGKGKPNIALLAEYDALEGLGHACGHHLIAGMSILAAIGIALNLKPDKGTITVVGCPAEETIGAKAILVKKGIFKPIDVAMMIHPADKTEIVKLSLSLERLSVTFKGIASHTTANPWHGRNALSGIMALFNAVDANRITMPEGTKINGIVKNGGVAPNIVPDTAEAEFYLRAKTLKAHNMLIKRFRNIVHGIAQSYNLTYSINKIGNTYYPLKPNMAFARVFERQMNRLKIKVDNVFTDKEPGSSDIGNVSQVIPVIHPALAITNSYCPAHSEAFKIAGNTPQAYKVMKTGAILLALTAFELYKHKALLTNIKKDHYIKYS
ncbi:MAG: M20 family metallopeptidase [bacterium]